MEIHELTQRHPQIHEQSASLIGRTAVTARQVPPGSDVSAHKVINPPVFQQQLDLVIKLWTDTVAYHESQLGTNRAEDINRQRPGLLRQTVRDIVEQRILRGNPQLASIAAYDRKAGTNLAEQITRLINAIADDPGSSGTNQAWRNLLLKLQSVQWMALKGIPEQSAQGSGTTLTTQGEIERQRFAQAAQYALAAVPSIRTMPVPPTANPHLNALLAAMGILRGYQPPAQENQ